LNIKCYIPHKSYNRHSRISLITGYRYLSLMIEVLCKFFLRINPYSLDQCFKQDQCYKQTQEQDANVKTKNNIGQHLWLIYQHFHESIYKCIAFVYMSGGLYSKQSLACICPVSLFIPSQLLLHSVELSLVIGFYTVVTAISQGLQ